MGQRWQIGLGQGKQSVSEVGGDVNCRERLALVKAAGLRKPIGDKGVYGRNTQKNSFS